LPITTSAALGKHDTHRWLTRYEVGGAALLDEHEPGLGQDSQVGGDGRLPDQDLADDLPDGHRAAMLGEQVEVSLAIPSCANIVPWRC